MGGGVLGTLNSLLFLPLGEVVLVSVAEGRSVGVHRRWKIIEFVTAAQVKNYSIFLVLWKRLDFGKLNSIFDFDVFSGELQISLQLLMVIDISIITYDSSLGFINNMQQDLQLVVAALKAFHTENYKHAEQALYDMDSQNPEFHQVLRHILISNFEPHLQLTAATFLNFSLIKKFQSVQLYRLVQFLSSILCQPKVTLQTKRCLERFATELVGKCSNSKQAEELIGEFILMVRQLLNQERTEEMFMVVKSFTGGTVRDEGFVEFVRGTIGMCVERLGGEIVGVKLGEWVGVIVEVMKRLADGDDGRNSRQGGDLLLEICLNPAILRLLKKIYQEKCGSPNQYLTFDQNHLELNKLKAQACNLHLKMIKYGQASEKQINSINTFSNHTLPYFYNSLTILAQDPNLIDKLQCQWLSVQMMKILTLMVKIDIFYAVFADTKQQLIGKILFPLLRITEDQMDKFETSPQQFADLATDTSERQQFEIFKTQAAALLEALADNIDGVTTLVAATCINSLKTLLQLPSPTHTVLLSKQQSLTILTVFSVQICMRQDILNQLRNLFQYHQIILNTFTPLELARLYLFLSYNFIDLFDKNLSLGSPYLNSAFAYHPHLTVQHMALDFVFDVSEKYFSKETAMALIARIPTCKTSFLWEIFFTYVKKKLKEMDEELMVALVVGLRRRVEIQLQRILKKEIDNNFLLMKSLNVVKKIVQVKKYLIDKPVLEQEIWMFHQFLQFAENINFSDDLLEIVNGVLSQKEKLGDRELALLPYVRAVFYKDGYIFQNVFQTVNLFILNYPLQTHPQATSQLLQLCILGLTPSSPLRQPQDTGQSLLFLQLLIFKTRKSLPNLLSCLLAPLRNILTTTNSSTIVARSLICLSLLFPYLNTIQFFPLISSKLHYFSGYQRTVLTFSLCSVMMTESNPLIIAETLGVIVRHLQDEVNRVENQSKQRESKRKIITPNASFKKSIDNLDSPWKREDMFRVFRATVGQMRANNKAVFDALVETLSEEVRNGLNDIVGLSCVNNTIRKTLKVRRDVFNKETNLKWKRKGDMNVQGDQDQDSQEENKFIRKRMKQDDKIKNRQKKKNRIV